MRNKDFRDERKINIALACENFVKISALARESFGEEGLAQLSSNFFPVRGRILWVRTSLLRKTSYRLVQIARKYGYCSAFYTFLYSMTLLPLDAG